MHPRWYLAPVALLALPPLALAACDGGGEGEVATPTPEVRVVTSDDGLLALEIPDGAVDDDTEITITAVPNEELPDELANLQGGGPGYTLEPDGLQFDEPVTATLELPVADLEGWPEDGADGYGLVSYNETDGREILEEAVTTYTRGADTVAISGPLTHFSWLTRTKGSLRASMEEITQLGVSQFAAVQYQIQNISRAADGVTMKGAAADVFASGAISITTPPDTQPADIEAGRSSNGDFDIQCDDEPGTGVYTLKATAASVVAGGSPQGTKLGIVLDSVVDCVETEGEDSATATPTSEPISIDLPGVLIDYLDAWGLKTSEQLNAVDYTEDAAGDHIFGDPSQKPGFTPGYTDIEGTFTVGATLSEGAAQTLTDAYPCNTEANGVITACQENTTFPAGNAYIQGIVLREGFPSKLDRICIIANVFNGGENEWQPQVPPYEWDFYQGASHWFEAGSGPGAGWSLFASEVGEGNAPRQQIGTFARVFIVPELRTVGTIIPVHEIPGATGYRGTADCHNEMFDPAQSGGDVPGANPTEPFTPLPDTFVALDALCGGRCLPPDPDAPEVLL